MSLRAQSVALVKCVILLQLNVCVNKPVVEIVPTVLFARVIGHPIPVERVCAIRPAVAEAALVGKYATMGKVARG